MWNWYIHHSWKRKEQLNSKELMVGLPCQPTRDPKKGPNLKSYPWSWRLLHGAGPHAPTFWGGDPSIAHPAGTAGMQGSKPPQCRCCLLISVRGHAEPSGNLCRRQGGCETKTGSGRGWWAEWSVLI